MCKQRNINNNKCCTTSLNFMPRNYSIKCCCTASLKSLQTAINVVVRIPQTACRETTINVVQFSASVSMHRVNNLLYGLSWKRCLKNQQTTPRNLCQNWCTTSLDFVPKLLYGFALKLVPKLPWTVCLSLLYGFAEVLPRYACQGSVLLILTAQKSPLLSSSP